MPDDEKPPASGKHTERPVPIGGAAADVSRIAQQVADATGSFRKMSEGVDESFRPLRAMSETLNEQLRPPPGMENLARRITEQREAIDRLQAHPSIAQARPLSFEPIDLGLELPPHPAHETNERLERIEHQFAAMQSIAANGAKIATDLQEYAATFLHDFKKAAARNDRAGRTAIKLGGLAVGIAVFVFLAQIAYTELSVVPRENENSQQALAGIRSEIEELRKAQALSANQIEQAARDGDAQTAAALRELIELLRTQQELSVPAAGDAPP